MSERAILADIYAGIQRLAEVRNCPRGEWLQFRCYFAPDANGEIRVSHTAVLPVAAE